MLVKLQLPGPQPKPMNLWRVRWEPALKKAPEEFLKHTQGQVLAKSHGTVWGGYTVGAKFRRGHGQNMSKEPWNDSQER